MRVTRRYLRRLPSKVPSDTFVTLCSQLGVGHGPHRLPHSQVGHDLLGSTQDRGELGAPLEPLHHLPHPRLRDGAASEDLARLVADVVGDSRAEVLQQRDGPCELHRLFLVRRVLHGERHRLQPRLHPLHLARQPRQLVPNHRLIDEPGAEHLALRRPLQALLHDQPAGSVGARHDVPALVVEIVHDQLEPLADLSEHVPRRNPGVLERHVRRPRRRRVRRLDRLGVHAFASFDEHQTELRLAPGFGHHGGDEVVGEDAVGDPLLDAADQVVRATAGQFRDARDVGDVGARLGSANRQTDLLLPREHLAADPARQGGFAELEHRG
mmetsp:Transcript_15366/g.60082  ORF Transcript_15366/g.60082 Transcript_15366/m.60082 type:complete len:325 (+) Transcript_15366:840-1814(+)